MHASLILTYDTDLRVLQQCLLDSVKVNKTCRSFFVWKLSRHSCTHTTHQLLYLDYWSYQEPDFSLSATVLSVSGTVYLRQWPLLKHSTALRNI